MPDEPSFTPKINRASKNLRRSARVEVLLDQDAKRRAHAQTEMKMKKDTEIKTPRKSTINNNSEKLIFVRFERDLN